MTPEEANRLEKAIRFASVLKKLDALAVPAKLVELEELGEVGKDLATVVWGVLTDVVSTASGRNETPPDSSREQLLRLCEIWQKPIGETFPAVPT